MSVLDGLEPGESIEVGGDEKLPAHFSDRSAAHTAIDAWLAEGEGGGIDQQDTDDGEGQTDDEEWFQPEIVEELPLGWYLMVQVHRSDEDRERWLIVGDRGDGQYIYITSGGSIRESAYHFDTADAALDAFEAWYAESEEGGGGGHPEDQKPSESAPRPDPAQVHDESAQRGVLSGFLTDLANARPRAWMVLALLVVASMYAVDEAGWVDLPLPEIYGYGGR